MTNQPGQQTKNKIEGKEQINFALESTWIKMTNQPGQQTKNKIQGKA